LGFTAEEQRRAVLLPSPRAAVLFFLLALTPGARADTTQIETVVVTGRAARIEGTAQSANQGTVSADDIALRPILRPGEIVENVPGVIVTQHSGSGKANQYFLRGFNLDHGTDLAVSIDGVPVNMPSHAHGQGYADLNFLIPELVQAVDYEKGPYYAQVGDFGSAGAFDIRTYDALPSGLASVEGGSFGYGRAVVADNAALAQGNLLYAAEVEHDDGPWDIADDARKLDGMLRYTVDDVTVTASAYHDIWHSTDQVPDRAIAQGLIDRWGAIDPSDGGATGRYALSASWRGDDARAIVYALHYDLDLFSDFTYFLDDPVHGDQIEQQDNRFVFGGKVSKTWRGELLGHESRTTLGLDVRNDDIRGGLFHTEDRARLAAEHIDDIVETSASPWIENETHWTYWFRSVTGLRGDFYAFDVHNIAGGASGNRQAALASPKLSLIFGPWDDTEFYLNGGMGFHSNDARGLVATGNPATPLPRSKGAEAGIRTAWLPGLQSAVSLWLLDLKSELVWDGDAGTNTPSGPTRRYGVEFSNFYTPTPWLTLDADYAWSHARFTDHETAGDYVPEALVATFDGGVALHDLGGALAKFSGGLRLRYFGPRPLTQDGTVQSAATTLVYGDIGYAVDERWSVSFDVFNLLNAKASDIDYYYVSRLQGEPLSGIPDIHTHPAEPREFRVALKARL
jgi:TonB dependent receptor/TonB-dependent Receptor Plug Domain